MSRLCEEFGCLPSQAIREWQTAPSGVLEDIMELRAFARAIQTYQHAQRMDAGPERDRLMRDPMVRLAQQFEFAPLIARQRAGDGG